MFEAKQEAWDKESTALQQQKAALAKGGSQADAVVKQVASWQASLPQTEQSLVQTPKHVMSFPVMKTRPASAAHGVVDRGSNKKKMKDDAPQAELQRNQAKNPVQVQIPTIISAQQQSCCYHVVIFWDGMHALHVVLDASLVDSMHLHCSAVRKLHASTAWRV